MAAIKIVLRDGAELTVDLSEQNARDLMAGVHGALVSDGKVKILSIAMPDGDLIVSVAHVQAAKLTL
jgi:hypothetical protein